MKSVTENQTWLVEQLQGAHCGGAFDIIVVLANPAFLADGHWLAPLTCDDTDLVAELDFENSVAHLAGNFSLGLAKHHLKRFLWMYGYPHMLTTLLAKDPDKSTRVVKQFEKDWKLFDTMSGTDNLTVIAKEVKARLVFNKVVVRQTVNWCTEKGFQVSEDLLAEELQGLCLGLEVSQATNLLGSHHQGQGVDGFACLRPVALRPSCPSQPTAFDEGGPLSDS